MPGFRALHLGLKSWFLIPLKDLQNSCAATHLDPQSTGPQTGPHEPLVPKPLRVHTAISCVCIYIHTYIHITHLCVYVNMSTNTNKWGSQIWPRQGKLRSPPAVAGHFYHFLCTRFPPKCFFLFVLPQDSQQFSETKRADTTKFSSTSSVLKSSTGSWDF